MVSIKDIFLLAVAHSQLDSSKPVEGGVKLIQPPSLTEDVLLHGEKI